MKKCKNCLQELPLDSYPTSKYKVNGDPIKRTTCKKCYSLKINSKKVKRDPSKVQDLEGEIWIDIKDYESVYAISNKGRIKSLTRKKEDNNYYVKRIIHEKIIKTFLLNSGYLKVNLKLPGQKKGKNCLVHRLVAKTFLLNADNKEQVNHINGIKTDNHVDNLEWCDNTYNQLHAYKLGLSKSNRLHLHHRCKQTKEGIEAIVDLKSKGVKNQIIADMFNCSISSIKRLNKAYVIQTN